MTSSNQSLDGSTPAPPAPPAQPAAPSRTILVVDDESTLRSALRRFFMRRGWRVVEAEDGEYARAMLLDGPAIGGGFDAVLSDIRMPRLSGVELHALVADVDASVARRFIFSSGDTGDEEAVACLERTHCPVIAKPFELGLLLSMAEQAASPPPPPPPD